MIFLIPVAAYAQMTKTGIKMNGNSENYSERLEPVNGMIIWKADYQVVNSKDPNPQEVMVYLQREIDGKWITVAHSSFSHVKTTNFKVFSKEYGGKDLVPADMPYKSLHYRLQLKNKNKSSIYVTLYVKNWYNPYA